MAPSLLVPQGNTEALLLCCGFLIIIIHLPCQISVCYSYSFEGTQTNYFKAVKKILIENEWDEVKKMKNYWNFSHLLLRRTFT